MTRKPLDEHWPDPDQLELADRAWDQIDLLLDTLEQTTACSNEAIRDLLGAITSSWPDPHEELQQAIKHQQWPGEHFQNDNQREAS